MSGMPLSYIEQFVQEVGIIFCIAVIFIYFKILNAYGYWKKRDVPFIPPVPLFGSVFGVFLGMESISTMQVKNYNTFKGHKYFGIYIMTRPHLVVRDPKLIYRILVKDFSSFQDRGIGLNSKINPLVENVLHSDGEKWKRLRSKLSSAFSPGKLTIMFPHMVECGEHIVHILKRHDKTGTSIDVHDFFTLYVTNIIGTCVYGFDSQTMNYPDSEFHKMCRKAHRPSWRTKLGVVFRLLIPDLMKYFKFKSFTRDVESYFLNLVRNCVRTRENEGIFKEDFIQVLMELRSQASESSKKESHESFNKTLIAANAFLFLMAGFETTVTTLSYCLYELANNLEIQRKLQKQIQEITLLSDGKIKYEMLSAIPYLDQVINETMRKYPVVTVILRKSTKDYKVPYSNLTLKEGSRIDIPVFAIHHDPDIYPEPQVFDPDRFSEENRGKFSSGTFLPFGCGPRTCIGVHFAMMEMKIALIMILQSFEVTRSDMTPDCMTFDKNSPLLLIPERKILLNVHSHK